MGTVLSFSPREKNPPYAVVDYGSVGGGAANGIGAGGHPFNNNKQEIVGNGVMASAAKSNEKSAKKHSMFLNALNWKKFSSASIPPSSSKSNKKQQQQQQQTAADKAATAAAMASRQFHAGKGFPQVRKRSSLYVPLVIQSTPICSLFPPQMQNLANVHPIRDDARNMESALCHGTKETKVSEICHSQRPLDDLLTLKVRMRLWSDGMAPGIAFFIDVLDTISKELWFRKVSLLIQIRSTDVGKHSISANFKTGFLEVNHAYERR